MTVCIAAVGSENTIITASDLKITKGYYSADIVSLKTWRIHPKWTAMLAGKISHHWPVTGELSRRLDDHKEYLEEDVADLCTKAYISYQRKLAYEKVLSPFGLSLDSFLAKRAELGDTMFERLWGEISRVQVGFDMLVVGFVGESPRIFVVSNPSEENPSFITYCDDVQFAAIGSGGYAAESTLFALSEYLGSSTESKIYQVLAAKFSSESASDVGTATYLRVLRPDGTAIRMDADFIEAKIRREWEDFGRPRMRPKGFALIKEALKVAESEQGSVGS